MTSPPFDISIDTNQEPATVRVVGEIDIASCGQFGAALSQATTVRRQVELDLDGVTYMDSSGLRSLLAAHQELEASGGSLRIVAMSGIVARLLDITGLTGVLAAEAR